MKGRGKVTPPEQKAAAAMSDWVTVFSFSLPSQCPAWGGSERRDLSREEIETEGTNACVSRITRESGPVTNREDAKVTEESPIIKRVAMESKKWIKGHFRIETWEFWIVRVPLVHSKLQVIKHDVPKRSSYDNTSNIRSKLISHYE